MLEKDFYNTLFRVAFFQQTCRNPLGEYSIYPERDGQRSFGVPFFCLAFLVYFIFIYFLFILFFANLVPQKIFVGQFSLLILQLMEI